jgi:hypothetical protein
VSGAGVFGHGHGVGFGLLRQDLLARVDIGLEHGIRVCRPLLNGTPDQLTTTAKNVQVKNIHLHKVTEEVTSLL